MNDSLNVHAIYLHWFRYLGYVQYTHSVQYCYEYNNYTLHEKNLIDDAKSAVLILWVIVKTKFDNSTHHKHIYASNETRVISYKWNYPYLWNTTYGIPYLYERGVLLIRIFWKSVDSSVWDDYFYSILYIRNP